jgi:HPr kinase/phosphorylase
MNGTERKATTTKKSITVGFLFEENRKRVKLEQLTGKVGFENEIIDKNVHRPGLALAGYVELFTYNRVQIVGNTEIKYLNSLPKQHARRAFEQLFHFSLPCVIITNNNEVDDELIQIAAEKNVAVFRTPLETTKLIYFIGDFLDDQFAPQTVVHGAFVDVYGVGVLFTGKSGIGKSEIALDLIERGHRLVADDVVTITRKGEGILIGTGNEIVKHILEIRGLGFVDVRSMFGIRAIRFQKRVEIVVELEERDPGIEYTRTGLGNSLINILGVELENVKLPIFPGKNVTVISEVIALNYLLKHYGYDAAKEFSARVENSIAEKALKKTGSKTRAVDYFEHDFE